MYLKLRIIFTILSALCAAAVIPIGSVFGFVWAGICAVGAFLFFVVMKICKTNQEIEEIRKNASAPSPCPNQDYAQQNCVKEEGGANSTPVLAEDISCNKSNDTAKKKRN